MKLFLLFASIVMVTSRFLTDLEVECSIVAILTEQRAESEDCNLKNLMLSPRDFPPATMTKSSTKRDVKKLKIQYCEPDEQCRIDGKRTCLCPTQHVCEPVNSQHSCVKFKFFRI